MQKQPPRAAASFIISTEKQMFYQDNNGWNYYSYAEKAWRTTGSQIFQGSLSPDSKAKLMHHETMAAPTLPSGALPAFSGSKVLCVGRNYRKHAAEMGNDVPSRPLWFTKPPSSIIGEGGNVVIPSGAGRIDYEGELVLIIGRRASKVPVDKALDYIGGVTACFDMTARELQKSDGQWTRAKGFDTFLPLASLVAPFSEEWAHGSIEVTKNNEIVQTSSFSAMVFGFAELVADISACMTLEPGDLILTGTPEGIGPVAAGDRLRVRVSGPIIIELGVNVCG